MAIVKSYYELPIKVTNLMQRNRELVTCELTKSIAQNIFLIISSKFGEHRFDYSYGCEIWDMDFETISNENAWIERVRKSVFIAVSRHETRLENLNADISISLDELVSSITGTSGVKKRLSIIISANISETGGPFSFNTSIYLSPLSIE